MTTRIDPGHAAQLLRKLHRCEVFIRSLRHEKLKNELESMIDTINDIRSDICRNVWNLDPRKEVIK